MQIISADLRHNFVHPVAVATLDEFLDGFTDGKPIVYYTGESLGMAKRKSSRVKSLAAWVWAYVVDGSRGRLHLRKVEDGPDGIHRYEYLAIPSQREAFKRSFPRGC